MKKMLGAHVVPVCANLLKASVHPKMRAGVNGRPAEKFNRSIVFKYVKNTLNNPCVVYPAEGQWSQGSQKVRPLHPRGKI